METFLPAVLNPSGDADGQASSLWTYTLSDTAVSEDFGEAFLLNLQGRTESSAASVDGSVLSLTGSAESVLSVWSTEDAEASLTVLHYNKPDSGTDYVYRFVSDTATLQDILTANGIVSPEARILSVSDPNLVTADGDTLTAHNFFGEVLLYLALSDGTQIQVRLINPAPVPPGQTVQGEAGSFTAHAEVPAGTYLSVSPLEPDAALAEEVRKTAVEHLGETVQPVRFFEVSLMGPDGTPVKASADVTANVDILLPEAPRGKTADVSDLVVFRAGESGLEILDAADFTVSDDAIRNISFLTDMPSVLGIAYTVDFHWNADGKSFSFTLPGSGFLCLEDLVEILGPAYMESTGNSSVSEGTADENPVSMTDRADISQETRAFVADIEAVSFSDPSLVWAGKVQEDTTVRTLKDTLGLEAEYSPALSLSEIRAINAEKVSAGTWGLLSLRPFDTQETLTVTMQGGESFSVLISDAQVRKTVRTARGKTWEVAVTYPEDAGIPENADLLVTEITGTDYDVYVSRAKEALRLDSDNLTYARLLDIRLADPENPDIKYEPQDGSSFGVTVHLADTDGGSLNIVHFEENSTTADILVSDTEKSTLGQTVRFETGGFSVFAIVGTVIEKNVLASDGHNYRITAIYGPETGIPADADLSVEEILSVSVLYDQFVSKTEHALGMEDGSAGYIRLFDISIVNGEDRSITYQPAPGSSVDVRIELADSNTDCLNVVHFADDLDEGSVLNTETAGQTVSFLAEGFSVYSVVSRESTTGYTDLDGKSYVLVTNNNALLLGKPLDADPGKLAALSSNPTVGGTLQVSGRITCWTFEAVEGQPGWYYISDGNGNYLNITSANGDGGTVTLGSQQPIYVASKGSGDSVTYQLRNNESQNGSKAVNNYGNNWVNGFGAWKSGNDNNEWFRFYDMEFLGDYKISFNNNGGAGAAPADIWGLAGDTVTLPDYSGTKNGYTFLGWSTGTNLVNNTYYPVYPPGSEYTIPDKNSTLFAVWTDNNPAQGDFFIRLDGTIPYEPDQYEPSAYTEAIKITGAIKKQVWVTDNDVYKPNNGLYIENVVTANLNQVPDADQLVSNINKSSSKLGFKVKNDNGEIIVSEITNAATNQSNYNVTVGNALYVLWYVQKHAGSWHVDGVLLVKDKVSISYDGNAPDGSVKNVPLGYQEDVGTDITIGASGGKNGSLRTPTRPGYIFLGWNLSADGSGTWYNNGDIYTLNEDTTLYAQWSKGTNMMTVAKMNEDGETLAGAQFKLEEKTSSGMYIEKANRTTGSNGTFTYDMMENDTLYRMTETYAPNGYEVQNSFFFKVAIAESGSSDLNLRVCDENGNYISTPDWLHIDYLPADDPRAQGVARIQFNVKDERIQRYITFIKVDEDGNALPGAEYTLINDKGTVSGVLKEHSDSNGVFSVENAVLSYGTYTLSETKSPVTFAASEPVTFTLNDYISETNDGLTIIEDRSGSVVYTGCEVSSFIEQGLTVTTYAYTIKVQDTQQAHIIVTKDVVVDGDLNQENLDTTIYFALTRKGQEGYVTNESGETWIEQMDIVNGVPAPAQVVFDGIEYGQYDVWEMALINGEYTRMYSGLVVADTFQLDSVTAFSADGGNNANVSADDLEANVDFTNHYGIITQSTSFTAHKKWTDRAGNEIQPPEGAAVELTLYSEKKDASGQIIENTQEEVRSINLDGIHDPDGEDIPWDAVFKYLPVYYEGNLEYSYKVKETVTVDGYYPNGYPEEYYLTNSGGTITNRKLLTDVELHKCFENYPEDPELLNTIGEKLTFTVHGPGGYQKTASLSEFTASPEDPYDYVLTLHDLPLGEYTVSESGQEELFSEQGYYLVYSVSASEGQSEIGSTEQPVLELQLENSYAKSGTLLVKKNSVIHEAVDETTVPADISGKEFAFVVRRGNLYLQEDCTLGTEPYRFSLQEGDTKRFSGAPAGKYTVIEQDASVEGYLWDVIDGTRNADGTFSKQLTIDDADNTGEAAFDNRYTRIESGSLTVNKSVEGGPEGAQTKVYKVEIKTTRHGEDMWLDADGNLLNKRTVLTISQSQPLSIPKVPAGTYTVTENVDDAIYEEYSLDVTYELTEGSADADTANEDTAADGATPADTYTPPADAGSSDTDPADTDEADTSAANTDPDQADNPVNTFTIHKDEQVNCKITNTYNCLYTAVKITKTVTGNMGDPNLFFGFDVYVRDADDQPIVMEDITDADGRIQFSLNHEEEKLLNKLPTGAKLVIVEHNEHYSTTVSGWIGVNDNETQTPLAADNSHDDEGSDTTEIYSFIIPETGATVDFMNDKTVEQSVVLKKIGYNNRDERTWDLADATFHIYLDAEKTMPFELDGKTEFTSGEDGVFYGGKLGAGVYYLDEANIPSGYLAPAGMYVLRIEESSVSLEFPAETGQQDLNDWISTSTAGEGEETVYTVSIRNTPGAELPATGGSGTGVYTLIGSILLCISLCLTAIRIKHLPV